MSASDQGLTLQRYLLIPRVLIFVKWVTNYLLIKGAPDKHLWANKYNGIGGHVESGEDILSAASRELMEEAGITADLWLCGMVVVDTGENPGVGIYVFTGEYLDGEPESSPEGKAEWISVPDVLKLPCVEDLPVLLKRIQGMKLGDPPFSARSYYDENQKLILEFSS
jgi:NUDIX domain.